MPPLTLAERLARIGIYVVLFIVFIDLIIDEFLR
jgi:hypothetical protein